MDWPAGSRRNAFRMSDAHLDRRLPARSHDRADLPARSATLPFVVAAMLALVLEIAPAALLAVAAGSFRSSSAAALHGGELAEATAAAAARTGDGLDLARRRVPTIRSPRPDPAPEASGFAALRRRLDLPPPALA